MEKVQCSACESMILESTFEKNDGKCMPCAGATGKNKENKFDASIYVGFWKRFGAYWLDVLIFLPIMALVFWGAEQSRLFHLYYIVPGSIIGILFHVYLVKKYGGTPGKLLLKIKIAKLDGGDVSYKEATLRYIVLFVLMALSSISLIIVTMGMTDGEYLSYDWIQRSKYLTENAPNWGSTVDLLINVWIWSEFIVMLTNKKRRALHDYIAGTVVVHKSIPNKPIKRD